MFLIILGLIGANSPLCLIAQPCDNPGSTNSPVCIGGVLRLTANAFPDGEFYIWQGPNGLFEFSRQGPFVLERTVNDASWAGTYTLTIFTASSNGSCGGQVTKTFQVEITSAPDPNPSSDAPVCEGSILNLTAAPIPGATYEWQGPNGFISPFQRPFIQTTTLLNAGVYTVTVTKPGCPPVSKTTNVEIIPRPDVIASSNSPVCDGEILRLSATNVSGATYRWAGPNGFTSTQQNPSIQNVNIAASGNYSVTVTVPGCPEINSIASVTIIPKTVVSVSTNSPICEGETLFLTASDVLGATYRWRGPAGFTATTKSITIPNATPAFSGTYVVEVSPGSGTCSQVSEFANVVVNSRPSPRITGLPSSVCVNSGSIVLTGTPTGGTFRGPGINGSVFTPADAGQGNHTIVYEGRQGACTYSTTATITVGLPIVPNINNLSDIYCINNAPVTLSGTPAGGRFEGVGISGNIFTPANAGVGTHMIRYTGTFQGCEYAVSRLVTVTQAFTGNVNIISNSPVCEGGTLALTPTDIGNAQYQWSGPNGFASTSRIVQIFSATTAAAGVYTLNVVIPGCGALPPSTTTVEVNAAASVAVGSNSPVCAGSVLLLTASTIPGARYNWSGPNGFSSTMQNPVLSGVTTNRSGIYVLTVQNRNCPPVEASVEVVVNDGAAATIRSNSPVCVGDRITLVTEEIRGASYNWSGPNNFTSNVAAPTIENATLLNSGQYELIVSVPGCPPSSVSANVIVNAPPVVPLPISNSPICAGSTLNLSVNGSPGTFYSWGGPGFSSTQQNPSIPNVTTAASGVYTVTLSVPGCRSTSATTTVRVTEGPPTGNAVNSSPICAGQTLSLLAPAGQNVNYNWIGPAGFSSTQANPVIINTTTLNAGEYTLTMTTPGCPPVQRTTLAVINASASVTVGSNSPVCQGGIISLSASLVAGGSYLWSGPAGFTSSLPSPNINNASLGNGGTYFLTVTIPGCGQARYSTVVRVNAPPLVPNPTNNSPFCQGGTLQLNATETPGATYLWTGPNGFNSTLRNPSIFNATAANSGTYQVQVSIPGCTPAIGNTTVTINPLPTINFGPLTPLCEGSILNLSVDPIPGATYLWFGPNGFSANIPNPSRPNITTNDAGQYTVRVTTPNCPPVSAFTTVVVNSPVPPPNPSSNTPVCEGNTLVLQAANIARASYLWVGPNGFTSTEQNPVINNATTLNTGTYLVTVSRPGCPQQVGSTIVVVNPKPNLNPRSNSPVCNGSVLTLSSNFVAGASYHWRGPNGYTSNQQNPPSIVATPANSGIYTLIVSLAGCGELIATTEVVVNSLPPTPRIVTNSPVCEGRFLTFSVEAIAGAQYTWVFPGGTTFNQNPLLVNNVTTANSGIYTLVTAIPGCPQQTTPFVVVVNAVPNPIVEGTTPVCLGNTLFLTATAYPGASYLWSGPNNFSSTLVSPFIENVSTVAAGSYQVDVTVPGCPTVTKTINVQVSTPPREPMPRVNSPVCSGGVLRFSLTPSANATYLWSGPNGFSSTEANPMISNATTANAGDYAVTVTVPGCPPLSGSTGIVVINEVPVPAPQTNSPVCVGASLELSAREYLGATYRWSGPNGFSSTERTPRIFSVTTAATGTYSLAVTVPACPPAFASTIVTVNTPALPPSPTSNSPICEGSSLFLTARTSINATYQWSGPAGFTSTLQNPSLVGVTSSNAGTYSVTVSVPGCGSQSGTVNVTINRISGIPTIASNSPICSGGTLRLTAGTITNALYRWSGPNNYVSTGQNASISGVTTRNAGVYTLEVIVNGCQPVVLTTNVVVSPQPVAPNPRNNGPLCRGGVLQLTATPSPTGVTYTWLGPAGFSAATLNPILNNVTTVNSGVYTLTVSSPGCTPVTGQTTVVVGNPPQDPLPVTNAPICEGSPLLLIAQGPSQATYTWSGPNNFSATGQNITISNATVARSGIYTVTVTQAGCTGQVSSTVEARVNRLPVFEVQTNSPICEGQTLRFTAPDIPGAIYDWVGPLPIFPSEPRPTFPNAFSFLSGIYTLNLTVPGCSPVSRSFEVTVNEPPLEPFPTSNSPVCQGRQLSLTAQPSPAATYRWSGPGGFSSTLLNPVITARNSGVYSLTVLVPGCEPVTATTEVVVEPTPNAPQITSNSPVCLGGILQLTASEVPGAFYFWQGPVGFTTVDRQLIRINADLSFAGTYSVIAQLGNCTSAVSTVNVSVITPPTLPTITASRDICAGQNLQLNTAPGEPGTVYRWSGPNGFTSTLQNPRIVGVTTQASGTYSLQTAIGNCFSPVATFTLVVTPRPELSVAGNNGPLCEGSTLQLTTSSFVGATYSWSGPGGFSSTLQNPILENVSATASGTYSVIAFIGNCSSNVQTTTVVVNPNPRNLTLTGNAPVCEGQPLLLNATPLNGATYNWQGPNGFSRVTNSPSLAVANITTSASGTYRVFAVVNDCPSPLASLEVVIRPINARFVTRSATICSNGQAPFILELEGRGPWNVTYNINGGASDVLTFGTANSPSPFTLNTTVTVNRSSTYNLLSVSDANGCTRSLRDSLRITVRNSNVQLVANNDGPKCPGASLQLSVNAIPNAVYRWSGPNNYTSSIQNPVISPLTTANAGVYSVVAIVDGCTSEPATTVVIVRCGATAN
ncbi:MAG: hypothetical protein NZ576_05485, partial [Bacteroidia bacterium]|nr:hypothetical protein [Bacteroidia bacterium]